MNSFKYISKNGDDEDIDFDIDESIGSDWDAYDKEESFGKIKTIDTQITYSNSSESDKVSPLRMHRDKEMSHEMEPLSPSEFEEQKYNTRGGKRSGYPFKSPKAQY